MEFTRYFGFLDLLFTYEIFMGYFSHCRGIQCTYSLNSKNLKADRKVNEKMWKVQNDAQSWQTRIGFKWTQLNFVWNFFISFCSSIVLALAPRSPLTLWKALKIVLFSLPWNLAWLFDNQHRKFREFLQLKRHFLLLIALFHSGCNAIEIVVNWKLYIRIW